MPAYFTSDVHLRLDQPERGQRFATWVESLEASDRLTIVGDLCDFWFAARQTQLGLDACQGLRALARFRNRGGELTILAGNHDRWLAPFYEKALGTTFANEPLIDPVYGLRIHMLHGQWLGGHPAWKGLLESRAFLASFRRLPSGPASFLDRRLERRNQKQSDADDERQLATYRRYAEARAGEADLVIIGHVHRPFDSGATTPRLLVPGGWFKQSAYIRVDESGATLIVEKVSCSATSTC